MTQPAVSTAGSDYAAYVNPQWQRLLSVLGMNVAYRRCVDTELVTAGGQLSKVFFCSSGSEGVEATIKFARARTGRAALLYNQGAFHGLTCGALSLMGGSFWRANFGPMPPRRARRRPGRVAPRTPLSGRRPWGWPAGQFGFDQSPDRITPIFL